MRRSDINKMVAPIGARVREIISTQYYYQEKEIIDEAIEFVFSTFMPYIVMAEIEDEWHAYAKGMHFELKENGIAYLCDVDDEMEEIRIPEVIGVQGRFYLVVKINLKRRLNTLKKMILNSSLQSFEYYAVSFLPALETIVCDERSLFKTIDNQLYKLRLCECYELIWVRPDDKLTSIQLPENLEFIDMDVFVNCPNLHDIKGANPFFDQDDNMLIMNKQETRLMLSDRNEYEVTHKWSSADTSLQYYVVLKRINSNDRVLNLKRSNMDGMVFVHGIDLEQRCESVEEIRLYGFKKASEYKKLPCNFILDRTMLPNLKTIDAEVGKSCAPFWVLESSVEPAWIRDIQCDDRTVLYLFEHDGIFYLYDGGITPDIMTRPGSPCSDSGNSISGELILPESIEQNGKSYKITKISAYSFDEKLISIKIPSTVELIEDCAFWGCSRLKRVEVADGVKAIGKEAFAFCEDLEEVILPKGIEIGEYAFPNDEVKIIYRD